MATLRFFKVKGDTLIEVIMALTIAVVILTAITTVTINSLKNSRQSTDLSTATNYAKDGLEIARAMYNNDYNAFKTLPDNSSYCLADTCKDISPVDGVCGLKTVACGKNVGQLYTREIYIKANETSCIPTSSLPGAVYTKVISTVFWQDGGCRITDPLCHKTQIESCLVNNSTKTSL